MSPSHRKSLVELFSHSLTSFQSSAESFRVLYTLPNRSDAHPQHQPPAGAPHRPSAPPRNLIVLDSSFNPPTSAHAQMVLDAVHGLGGEESAAATTTRVVLLLAVNNADKAPRPAGFPVRLGMMEGFGREVLRAVQGSDGAVGGVCGGGRLEVDLAVTTMPFFHDKARVIAESDFYRDDGSTDNSNDQAPSQKQQQRISFLAGFDTLTRIFTPKYYAPGGTPDAMRAALAPFFARARLRVTTRPDDAWGGEEEQRRWLEEREGEDWWKGRVEMVAGGGVGRVVSSSMVRGMVRDGEEGGLDGLVGEDVRGWIEEEELYRDG